MQQRAVERVRRNVKSVHAGIVCEVNAWVGEWGIGSCRSEETKSLRGGSSVEEARGWMWRRSVQCLQALNQAAGRIFQ